MRKYRLVLLKVPAAAPCSSHLPRLFLRPNPGNLTTRRFVPINNLKEGGRKSYAGLHGQDQGGVLPLGNAPGLNSGVLRKFFSRYTDLPRMDFCQDMSKGELGCRLSGRRQIGASRAG